MITLQIGNVNNDKLVVSTEVSMIDSYKDAIMKDFNSLKLNGNQAAVIINRDSGGVLRKGKHFDMSTIKTII